MTTVQQIIDSGNVDESIDTNTLWEALQLLEFQVKGLKESNFGKVGQMRITRYEKTIERIQIILNARPRYGLDDMTLLAG